jgi:hypothetical protein
MTSNSAWIVCIMPGRSFQGIARVELVGKHGEVVHSTRLRHPSALYIAAMVILCPRRCTKE